MPALLHTVMFNSSRDVLNDRTGVFAGFGWLVFPILNQDNVAQVFFTAGFEQRVVMVGRDNGNNQIGLARDFAEAGIGGNACNTAVSKIDGGDFALIWRNRAGG